MREMWISLLLVGAVACGGGGAKYHVNDTALASASVQEKQGVLAAQQEKEIAKTEQQKAEADLKNAENELDVAENDYKAAKLSLDSFRRYRTAPRTLYEKL